MEIKVRENDLEKALKMLKTKLQKDGFFREIKKRKHYEKPSVKRKRKQAEARKRKAKSAKFRQSRPMKKT
ncbi:MAG TPA: 30S ribosomal protein S21 [Dissulfurispiraceae bacterium]|nr:30S ribosomal protein S21 [Dissulfurispiraceae bacterium]